MRVAVAALVWTALGGAGLAAPARGVALGLFAEDPGWSYRPLLDEIAATGADHVELVVAWYLDDVRAVEVREHPRFTAPADAVERAVADAHAAGLKVLLFPILRLARQDAPDEWRGTLRPRDHAALMASYRRALVGLARLAERNKVERLSIGSELSTLDADRAGWPELVAEVRRAYRGRLTYSGNWDHFRAVAIYDLVDDAGVCGYFPLAVDGAPASDDDLVRAWRDLRAALARFSAQIGRPLVLTEVGYLSQRGSAAWPWDEGATKPVDLEEQRRCYAAFRRAWTGADYGGVFFWNWYGWGGASSRGYTPRGKPAAEEIRALFRTR